MMMGRIRQFARDERGAVVIMVGAVIALLFVFTVYAIDASQMFLVRTQLQNAADAGALAGALMMGFTGDSATAVNEAIAVAGANTALLNTGNANSMESVVITDDDVTFPEPGRIRVTTHRTTATNDAFMNYFLRIFKEDGEIGEMTAVAAAHFHWVCGANCVKPWAPPDRWTDLNGNGRYDAGEPYDPVVTGYTDADLGAQITLVLGNGSQQNFGEFWYYSIDFPPIGEGSQQTGADPYREWICGCRDEGVVIDPGDIVQVEPGAMTGPNRQGLDCLFPLDPNAQWDVATGTVINSAHAVSPRIVKVAFFNPQLGLMDNGGRKQLEIVKIGVLFLESYTQGGDLVGRFMRLAESDGVICENQSDPSFLFKTALVE